MSDPTFLSRSDLGMARPVSVSRNFNASQGGVATHWGGGAQRISDLDQAVARWLAWQRYHMGRNHPNGHPNGHNWVDIGYNVGYWKSYVFAGRGYGIRPAAQRAGNSDHLAVVWIGGSGEVPDEEDFATLAWIVEDARENGNAGLSVKPHNHWVGTACPGPDISNQSKEWDGKRIIVPEIVTPDVPPPPAPSRSYITRGDTGSKVREWQRLLLDKDFALPRFGADGQFGNETVAATNAAYAAIGLSASDPNNPRVGDRSFRELKAYNPEPWRGKRVVARTRVRFYRRPGWHPSNPTAGFLDEGWGFRGGIHEKRRVGGGYQYQVSNSNGHRYWITANERFVRLLDN